jgi:hypothetical protein
MCKCVRWTDRWGKEYQSASDTFQQKDAKTRDKSVKLARSRTFDSHVAKSDDLSARHDELTTECHFIATLRHSACGDGGLWIVDWRLEIGDWRLEIGDWRLEIGDWRLEDGCELRLLAGFQSTTHNLQSTIHHHVARAVPRTEAAIALAAIRILVAQFKRISYKPSIHRYNNDSHRLWRMQSSCAFQMNIANYPAKYLLQLIHASDAS